MIGYVAICFGAVDALFSLLVGKLFPSFGKKKVVAAASVIIIVVPILYLVVLYSVGLSWLKGKDYVLFLTAGIIGLGDVCDSLFSSKLIPNTLKKKGHLCKFLCKHDVSVFLG